jgi:hypothetical protein
MDRVLSGLLGYFINWPLSSGDSIAAVWFAIIAFMLIFAVMMAITCMMVDKDKCSPSPEVPADIAAITLSKDKLWMKVYYGLWGSYPRNLCAYVERSVFMAILLIVTGTGAILAIAGVIPILCWGILGLLWLIAELPSLAVFALRGIAQGVSYAIFMPITYQLLAVLTGLVLFVLFLRSQTWQIIKLWIKSKKEKYCLSIRVV